MFCHRASSLDLRTALFGSVPGGTSLRTTVSLKDRGSRLWGIDTFSSSTSVRTSVPVTPRCSVSTRLCWSWGNSSTVFVSPDPSMARKLALMSRTCCAVINSLFASRRGMGRRCLSMVEPRAAFILADNTAQNPSAQSPLVRKMRPGTGPCGGSTKHQSSTRGPGAHADVGSPRRRADAGIGRSSPDLVRERHAFVW